jgi:hypothetical protein
MCSSLSAQLSLVCLAIEELAEHSAGGEGALAERKHAQGVGEAEDHIAARLAAIWAMVADADPELARRLPGYMI